MSETSIEKLLELMRQLRDPDNGCEWDKKQTFESLLPYLDEEAKEVAEAIKNKDYINLKEELGDLLLQIIFHSEIAKEKKLFSFNDVIDTLSEKLIRGTLTFSILRENILHLNKQKCGNKSKMKKKMIFVENIKGIISFTILLINTLALATLMIPLGIIKFLIPIKTLRVSFTKLIIKIGEIWISVNSFWVLNLLNPDIEIKGFESLNKNEWYLATSNHQSWADIFMVQMLTNKKIPMLKFFMKHILIYVPVIGICWWALDMPFLKRYTKEQIKKKS